MKKILLFSILLVFVAGSSFQSKKVATKLPKEFTEMLKRAKLKYVLKTKEYTEVKPIKNYQMNYEYAIKHNQKNFEIRFAIRPYDTYKKQKEDSEKNNEKLIEFDSLKESIFQVTIANISGGQFLTPTLFPPEAVKEEFNADWGGVVSCRLGKEFGQDYKYCLAMTIYKKEVGSAYIFFVTDNSEDLHTLVEPVFHALKFE